MSPLMLYSHSAVLFPGGKLPLRIHTPRQLKLMRHCLANEGEFLLTPYTSEELLEWDKATRPVACRAQLIDFNDRGNNSLAVMFEGRERVRLGPAVLEDGRLQASYSEISPYRTSELPSRLAELNSIANDLMNGMGEPWASLPRQENNADWLSARLVELLPLASSRKRSLFEIDNPIERLNALLRDLPNPEPTP